MFRIFQLRREICRTLANCPTTFISPFQIYSSCKLISRCPNTRSRKTKMHPPPHSLWVIWPSLKPSPSSSSFARTQLTLFCSTLFLAKAKALRLSTSIAYNWTFNSLSTGNRIIIPLCQYTKFESKARCELDQLLESQSHLQMVHTKRERSDPKVYSANSTCKSRRGVETRTQEQRFHLSEGKKDTLKRQMYPANTLKEQ